MSTARDPLWRRVMLMVGRGLVATFDDGGSVQYLKVVMGAAETQSVCTQ